MKKEHSTDKGIVIPTEQYGKITLSEFVFIESDRKESCLINDPQCILYYLAILKLKHSALVNERVNNRETHSMESQVSTYISECASNNKLIIENSDRLEELISCFDILYYGNKQPEIVELAEELSFILKGEGYPILLKQSKRGLEKPMSTKGYNLYKEALTNNLFEQMFESHKIDSYISYIIWDTNDQVNELKLTRNENGEFVYSDENPKPISITLQGLRLIIKNETRRTQRDTIKHYVNQLYRNLVEVEFFSEKEPKQILTSDACFIHDMLVFLNLTPPITRKAKNKENKAKRDFIANCIS